MYLESSRPQHHTGRLAIVCLIGAAALLAAACSSDSSDIGAQNNCPEIQGAHILDRNGDGEVKIGVATPGPRDDGAYYEALVNEAQRISEQECFEGVLVVDNIRSAEAETTLRNLAGQDVDMIAVGSTDIAAPLEILLAEFPDILWYCNCGSGFEELPGLIQSRDDSSEINYTAGVATGLLLQRGEGSRVLFLGCCDLDFERESRRAFETGLEAVNPDYQVVYVATGSFPFDFNNTPAAVEALTANIDDVDAVYPFLGDAHEPVVQRANENDILTMSAGASDVCGRTDLEYDIAVRFDAGDYLDTILSEIVSGELTGGEVRKFTVGVDQEAGAVICQATPEEQREMEAAYEAVGNGSLNSLFQEIKAEIYG